MSNRATIGVILGGALAVAVVLVLALHGGSGGGGKKKPTTTVAEIAACADTGDRLTKLQLLQNLPAAPHVLVLGSSRARPVMPNVLQGLTGGSVFNAGVHGGNAADMYVFARVLAQEFPHATPQYLIFVDVGMATDGLDPELADLPVARPFLGSKATFVKTGCTPNGFYDANGGLNYPPASKEQEHAQVMRDLPAALEHVRTESKAPQHIDPAHTKWFLKLLSFIKAQHRTPVIVLNPMYPSILAARRRYGFPELKAAMDYIAYLRHQHYRFVFINAEDIRKWGGSAANFSNFDHIDRTNMSKLLAYVVAHSNGILKAR
jgi:hypothetical protein